MTRINKLTASGIAQDGDIVLADATSGSLTITLPNSGAGTFVLTKKSDATVNTVTVSAPNGEKVNGAATYVMSQVGEMAQWYSDGSAWHSASPSNVYIAGQGAPWRATDNGFLVASGDPVNAQSTFTLTTAGTVYGTRLHFPYATTVTNIVASVQTAGSVLTSAQCFASLYSGTTLIGSTADQSTAWGSTGTKVAALVGGPLAVPAGDVNVTFYFNGTTGPTFASGAKLVGTATNQGLATPVLRHFSADTGKTTTPPATLGAQTSLAASIWVALS